MNVELRWLKSFLAVAEEMHFSRAARRLNLAQPALTAQIRQLEETVGARLFERSNRMGGLTAAGRALLGEAQAVVQHAETLPHIAQRAAHGEWGVLRLGVIPPAATPAVAEALRRFAAQFPDVEIQVRQSDQEKLLLRLGSGDLDLVLGRPDDDERPPQIHTRRLFVEEQGVVLREDDARAGSPAVALKALASSRLLLLRGNPYFGQLLLEHARKHGVELPRCIRPTISPPSTGWCGRVSALPRSASSWVKACRALGCEAAQAGPTEAGNPRALARRNSAAHRRPACSR